MKKKQSLFPLLIGFIIFVFWIENSLVYAQDISNSKKLQCGWLNLGLGLNSWEISGPGSMELCGGGNFSYLTGSHLFSIRFIYSEEMGLFSSSDDKGSDFGVLYGRIAKAKYGFASISAGIGVISRDSYPKEFVTVGIPIQSQLFFTPLPFFGIGLYPFTNLNLMDIPVGLLLCIQIGKLR